MSEFVPISNMPGVEIRYTEEGDVEPLIEWLLDPATQHGFPVGDEAEVKDAATRWIEFYKQSFCLTAVKDGTVVGIGILFVQHYKQLTHQCMHILVIDPAFRGQGIGNALHEQMMALAKERFGVELFHVEVYGDEEAVLFYKKRGYQEFGRQVGWIKDGEELVDRVMLERFI